MSFFGGAFSAGFATSVWALSLVVGHTGYPAIFIAAGLLVHASTALLAFSRFSDRIRRAGRTMTIR
jgi:predicted MFS family arabinose efflux permease